MSRLNMISLFVCACVVSNIIDCVQSRYVYQPSVQRWITQHKVVATWGEAKHRCEKEGAILASPVDKDLLKYMKSFIDVDNHASAYYIGTKARYDPEPQFSSIEGILLDDMPEAVIDMIDQLDPRDGDCLSMDRKTISVVPCWSRLPYICYTNVTTMTSTTESTTSVEIETTTAEVERTTIDECYESGFERSPTGGCYKLYSKHSTWREANATCAKESAYLVIFNDENEAKTVVQMFSNRDKYSNKLSSSWVGIRDDNGRGHWRSVHGDRLEEIYNVWHKYSTNLYVGEACALVNGDAKLFDYFCNYYYSFICEKDI